MEREVEFDNAVRRQLAGTLIPPKVTFMAPKLKGAAIPRAGLEYQDLVGISRLLDFYSNKSKYLWIELESEDRENGYLDDVVAALADGSFEIIQVKYTADHLKYHLDWDWLLEKTGRGTSLLVKWATTLRNFTNGPVSLACLQTNRTPDIEFASTLATDGRVQFDRLTPARRVQVEAAAGGAYLARRFFKKFRFIHSQPLLDDLDEQLRSSVVPVYADAASWLLLKAQAKRWAMYKGQPAPDGRVTYDHLTQLITRYAPRPIPQSFLVPDGYIAPSRDFHTQFMDRITKENATLSVLWGTPGRGKSTYLSFLTSTLRTARFPVIRHHYFLSLDDATADRFSFVEIATSLMEQMSVYCPDAIKGLEERPTELRKWIEACGRQSLTSGKPFVVIVDGLDHVWRERQNLTQLDHLFDHLLPCPTNVCLVVGTQRISDDKLPAKLVARASAKTWSELPAMDEGSVLAWIRRQHKTGRLLLGRRAFDESLEQQIGAVGTAFFKISLGHPLHLIYSFEALVRAGSYVTPEDVQLLPPCPTGNIDDYYRILWRKLPEPAKRVIHIIAGSDFHWPEGSLVKLFGSIDEVDFLLEHRRSGLIPFHGSILAFVRSRSDHKPIFQKLVPRVIKWLKKDAPNFYRWGWLWLMEARNGNARPLIKGADRAWAIASIAAGLPLEQMQQILAEAETITFANHDYAKTIELRSLKIRISAAPKFQFNNFPELTGCALSLNRNDALIAALADSLSTLEEHNISMIAEVCAGYATDITDECIAELRRRIDLWIDLRHRSQGDFVKLARLYVRAAGLTEHIDVAWIVRFIGGFRDGRSIYNEFLNSLVRSGRVALVADLLQHTQKKNKSYRLKAYDGLVRASGAAAVYIEPLLRAHKNQPLSGLAASWLSYHKAQWTPKLAALDAPKQLLDLNPSHRENFTAENYFYEFFFHALAEALARDRKKVTQRRYRQNTDRFADRVMFLLGQTAVSIATGQSQLSFATPYFAARAMVPIKFKMNDSESSQYIGFRNALRRIAVDLHILKQPTGHFFTLADDELRVAEASAHWNEELWIDEQLERGLAILTGADADALLARQVAYQDGHVMVFNERAEKWVQLSRLARLYNSALIQQLLLRAADCVIGYGWRKDLWMIQILNCVGMVHRDRAADGLPMLRRLVPIIEQITEFTDGDETDHVRSELIETIAAVAPDRLPSMYAHHIDRDEYRYADIALKAHARIMNLAGAEGRALVATFVEYDSLSLLGDLAAESPIAEALLQERIAFLGGMPSQQQQRGSDTTGYEHKGKPPNVKRFGPNKFRQLIKALAYPLSYEHQYSAMREWLRYWDSRGQAIAALATVKEYFEEEENPHLAENLLDEAFVVSLRSEGKKAAYHWIKLAHIHRHGWDNYFTSPNEVNARLQKAVQYYPQVWKRFIADTAEPAPYWRRRNYSFSLGTEYLVRYLLLAGQKHLAADYTRACIRIVEAEVSDQPIPDCPWFY